MGARPRKPSGPAVMTAQTGRTQDCTPTKHAKPSQTPCNAGAIHTRRSAFGQIKSVGASTRPSSLALTVSNAARKAREGTLLLVASMTAQEIGHSVCLIGADIPARRLRHHGSKPLLGSSGAPLSYWKPNAKNSPTASGVLRPYAPTMGFYDGPCNG